MYKIFCDGFRDLSQKNLCRLYKLNKVVYDDTLHWTNKWSTVCLLHRTKRFAVARPIAAYMPYTTRYRHREVLTALPTIQKSFYNQRRQARSYVRSSIQDKQATNVNVTSLCALRSFPDYVRSRFCVCSCYRLCASLASSRLSPHDDLEECFLSISLCQFSLKKRLTFFKLLIQEVP